MTDVYNKETRSYVMSRVRSKDTKPELIVRKYLFSQGFRYRLHVKELPGKPDIVLPKYKTVIFVNGCFWHGHNKCERSKLPQSKYEYWNDKVRRNKEKDRHVQLKLKKMGYNVIVIWECQLMNKVVLSHMIDGIGKNLC